MTQTMAPRKHADGGTYVEVTYAATRDGWGINITKWTTYRGNVVFEVNRVSPDARMLRLDRCTTEPAAREAANAAWRKDR